MGKLDKIIVNKFVIIVAGYKSCEMNLTTKKKYSERCKF